MHEQDDGARRERLLNDPRRDPTEPPPAMSEEEAKEESAFEQDADEAGADERKPKVESKAGGKGEPDEKEKPKAVSKADKEAKEKPKAEKEAPEPDDEPPSSRRGSLPEDMQSHSDLGGSVVTASDPRIAELEPLVAAANWEAVLKKLGTPEDAGKLPPNLGLLYALAHKEHNIEIAAEDGKEKRRDPDAYDPNVVAIRCMGGLFGVASASPIALVLGKRLIRSNPVGWQKKKAPSAPISVLIVALGLAIGAGIGWLLSFGYVTFKLPTIPFLP